MTSSTIARIYVGTYAKYNSGSLKGAWLDLEDYSDNDEFLAACAALHSDENDPEFMFQDYEGFPRDLYGESDISDVWEWLKLDDEDRELLAVYQSTIGEATMEQARDAYAGSFDNPADWAEQFLNDCGDLQDVPEHLRNYIDFEAYARDAGFNGMAFEQHGGQCWVFSG